MIYHSVTSRAISELKNVVSGEVLNDEKTLEHYSSDGSIFSIKPWAVVLPRGREDIRELILWLAKKKKETADNHFSLVCRGKGTDQAGGPLGEGVIVRFPSHLDKILEVSNGLARVEPGVIFTALNNELAKIGQTLPPYPASTDFSTLGGAVANAGGGEKSAKYGTIRDYVAGLKVFLSSGDEIETKPLTAGELAAKKSQNNFEGEIYRRLDDLIEKNRSLIGNARPDVTKNASGYALWEVKKNDLFDLGQLIIGSQGTLAVITEIIFRAVARPENTGLILGYFDSLASLSGAIEQILPLKPSAVEMVDHHLLEIVQRESPETLAGLMPDKFPGYVLMVEFDGLVNEVRESVAAAEPMVKSLSYQTSVAYTEADQERLWRLRRSAAAVVTEKLSGPKKAIPFVEDSTVHPRHLAKYLGELEAIARKHKVEVAVWGHAADGDLHFQPLIDLSNDEDRAKIFDIANDVFNKVKEYKGTASGEHNDGLMRPPFLDITFGREMVDLFFEVKEIFDPLGIFNPYKKVNRDLGLLKKYLRRDYNVK